jgi:hypothetical protein
MRPRCLRMLAVAVAVALLASVVLGRPASASASPQQVSIIQDPVWVLKDPQKTLSTFQALGASMVRVIVDWALVAPSPTSRTVPPGFVGTDPADYPAANWAPYDEIVKIAAAAGMRVDFTVSGGAPRWAEGPGIPRVAIDNPFWAWRPSASEFGQFVRAVGQRYSGTYSPPGQTAALPRVSVWGLWNEPNFGEDLGPQAVEGSTVSVAPGMYRSLLDAAWNALRATGHGPATDTILIGEVAARGLSGRATPSHPEGLPGDFGQTKPLTFLRTLYCVGASYRELRGVPARAVGCPTTAAGSRRFRAQNPALFAASAFADHPYPDNNLPPSRDSSHDPNDAPFSQLANLEHELDRLQGVYGSHERFPIYDTEYGYITHPPNAKRYVSPATAAYYINWAEYLSWKQPRVASTMQYLLYDPPPDAINQGDGGFSSGLLFSDGRPKPTYAAYRLPLYLPVTSTRRGRPLEVWGCIRPARYAIFDTGEPQTAQIQFAPGSRGAYAPVATVTVGNPNNCYFDLRLRFPASGTVRLAYTYPAVSPGVGETTVYSRTVFVALG